MPAHQIHDHDDDWEQFLVSPVILTGRGGSGTRLISEIAHRAGVFLGNDLNFAGDSEEWVNLIYLAAIEKLQLAGNTKRLAIDAWKPRFIDRAREVLQTGRCSPTDVWGWKLPESMLILPELFDIFPAAKLVHLVRHPVDASLRRTHMTSRVNNPIGSAVLEAAYPFVGRDSGKINTDEDYMRNAISWEFQVNNAANFARNNLTPDQYLNVRFEDLCEEPHQTQSSIASFIDINRMLAEAPPIDPERIRRSEPPDARADLVWEICGETARKFGYEPT